jgi:hypothetical protein
VDEIDDRYPGSTNARTRPRRSRPRALTLAPEPLFESDAPEIVAEAERAVQGVTGTRVRAERLTRLCETR